MDKYEALDIEILWDNNIAKPICVAITSGDRTLFKRIDEKEIDSDEIIKFIYKKCSSKKIYYVHNLTFEIFTFLKTMQLYGYKFKIISSDKIVYSAEIWKEGGKKIKLRCSYRLTMLPLRELAYIAKTEGKGNFPYNILKKGLREEIELKENMFNDTKEYVDFTKEYGQRVNIYEILESYCKNDVNITKKSIIEYWNIIAESGLNTKGRILSAGKLSLKNYFTGDKLVKEKIKIIYDKIIRKAYYGGRVEVFGNVRENEIALHYDWKGMYAQCMSEKVLGGELKEYNNVFKIEKPGYYCIKFTQNLDIPVLPIKKDKLLFVNGSFEGWYWFEEILFAMKMGVKVKLTGKAILSDHYDFFLKDFVEINNKIREKGDLYNLIGKNNNNAFYGRLGMDPERLEEKIINDLDNINNYDKIVEKNGILIAHIKKTKSISNVSISASITSKARIKLYKGILDVQEVGGRLLYVDTDSIIAAFDKKKYKNVTDVKIGEVFFDSKKNDTIIKDSVFALPKTYALRFEERDVVKIKGFNSKPNFNEFKKIFYNKGNIITEYIEWSKKNFNIEHIKKEKKTNLNSLNKRKWDKDMKDTKPIKYT